MSSRSCRVFLANESCTLLEDEVYEQPSQRSVVQQRPKALSRSYIVLSPTTTQRLRHLFLYGSAVSFDDTTMRFLLR